MSGGIQLGCGEHICEGVVVSVDYEWWRVVKMVSEPLTYGPLHGQELQLTRMKVAVRVLDPSTVTTSFPCCLW